MSLTSISRVVQLRGVDMSDLRPVLEEELNDQQLRTELENLDDTEIHLKVSKPPRSKTLVKVERLRHRPLEVVVEVDYAQADIPLQVRRKREGQSNSGFSYRWIWLVFIFGGAIISLVSGIFQFFEEVFGLAAIDRGKAFAVLIPLMVLVPVLMIWGVPAVVRLLNSNKRGFDERVLDIVSRRIEGLNKELIASDIVRCWSCFKEISFDDRVCPFCGKRQKD